MFTNNYNTFENGGYPPDDIYTYTNNYDLIGDYSDADTSWTTVGPLSRYKQGKSWSGYNGKQDIPTSVEWGQKMANAYRQSNEAAYQKAVNNIIDFAKYYQTKDTMNGVDLNPYRDSLKLLAKGNFDNLDKKFDNTAFEDLATLMADAFPAYFSKDTNNGGRTRFGAQNMNNWSNMHLINQNLIRPTVKQWEVINGYNNDEYNKGLSELHPIGQVGGYTVAGLWDKKKGNTYVPGAEMKYKKAIIYDPYGNEVNLNDLPEHLRGKIKINSNGSVSVADNRSVGYAFNGDNNWANYNNLLTQSGTKAYGGYNRYDDGGMMPPDQGMGGGSPVEQVLAMLSQLPPDQLQQVVQALMQMAQGGGMPQGDPSMMQDPSMGGGMPPQGGMPPEGMMAYGGYNRYANGGNISRRTSMAFGNYLKKKGY